VLGLDEAGFEVSAGSACSSSSLDASHVLTAMGIPRRQALGSLRISFDERVLEKDLSDFADALLALVASRTGRASGAGASGRTDSAITHPSKDGRTS
jgi:cysteine desulfurase